MRLTAKNESCHVVMKDVHLISDSPRDDFATIMEQVKAYLTLLVFTKRRSNACSRFDTHTPVFEVEIPNAGVINGGGGRYDGLVEFLRWSQPQALICCWLERICWR